MPGKGANPPKSRPKQVRRSGASRNDEQGFAKRALGSSIERTSSSARAASSSTDPAAMSASASISWSYPVPVLVSGSLPVLVSGPVFTNAFWVSVGCDGTRRHHRTTCLLLHSLSYPLSNFSSMNDKIRRGSALLEEGLADFDPRTMTGEDAAKMVHLLSGVERIVVAAKALSARRVEETRLHRRQGHRDAAHWLASETGEPAADSAGLLNPTPQME